MSLLSSLSSSSDALSAFDRAIAITQNNVTNASTPGYATQRAILDAQPFDLPAGLSGGVSAGVPQSTRNVFAEAAVDRAQTSLGTASQQAASLGAVQSALGLSDTGGIPATLGNLFSSFSAWSQNPTSVAGRQAVVDSAQRTADSFRTTVVNLQQVRQDTETQISQQVDQINGYAQQLQTYNVQVRAGDRNDAGLDAKIYATVESLSQLANITTSVQSDGTVTVLLGGQTPLVIGDQQYNISRSISAPSGQAVPPSAAILDASGRDVTAQVTGGQLGALLQTHNQVLASLLGDATQPGSLNRLAQAVADRVNALLTAGTVSDGPPAVSGGALFSYDTSNVTNVAASLAMDPSMTPDQLAAIDPGPPYVSNGTALKLAGLANPQNSADQIDNISYVQFFGNAAADVGRRLSAATDQQAVQQQVVTQAQTVRQQISGVSLDEQAALLVEYQRTYQANAQFFVVLNSITQTAVNLLGAVA